MDFYLIRVFFTPIKICLTYWGQDLLRFKGTVHVACAKKDLTVHHNCLCSSMVPVDHRSELSVLACNYVFQMSSKGRYRVKNWSACILNQFNCVKPDKRQIQTLINLRNQKKDCPRWIFAGLSIFKKVLLGSVSDLHIYE